MRTDAGGVHFAKLSGTIPTQSLHDRGQVAVGQRADLLRVRMNRAGMPSVLQTLYGGQRAF